jgi:hypothetical protein
LGSRFFFFLGGSALPSLGARFCTRFPQYGHSVTYGLTSAEQDGQMIMNPELPSSTL